MKRLLLLAGLLACAGGAVAATPFEARCEEGAGARVARLTASDEGYVINHSTSFRRLTNMKLGEGGYTYVLGLTRAESRVSIQLDGKLLSDPQSGQECIAPQIDVKLSYVPITVYVGREFPFNSCSYQEILAHEMRHLKAYLDHLSKVESVVRAALNQRFGARPVYAPIGQAKRLLAQEIDAEWLPFIKRQMDQVSKLHTEIDTQQEYARLSRVCQGEVQFFIKPPHIN